MDDRKWSKRAPLESALPHIIVDSTGVYRAGPLKSKAAATRLLHKLQRKPSPFLIGDPKTWTVQPVRADD